MTHQAYEQTAASVLIVDRSEETREVLRTVLQRRGVDILEAKQADQGLEILRERHPNVVVLDLEQEGSETDELHAAYASESLRSEASLVILGRVQGLVPASPGSRTIDKPYHYGPLIRTIEQLLEQHENGHV